VSVHNASMGTNSGAEVYDLIKDSYRFN
jgi:hypothetical protein